MRRLVFLVLVCVCSVCSQTYYMNIHLKGGGGTSSFPIQNNLRITFTGDSVNILAVKGLATAVRMFALRQNYPNPFNPTTTIEYQLPKAGDVEIKIFSINGQLVKILKSTTQPQGAHSVVWDGKNTRGQTVASGLYVYQVAFENSLLAKKMLLIR